jgi:hypothetical protein
MEGKRPPALDIALVKGRPGVAGQGAPQCSSSFDSALCGLLAELHRRIMEEHSRFTRQGSAPLADQVRPIDNASDHMASLRSLEQVGPLKSALADLPSPKRRKDNSPKLEKPEQNSSRRCTVMIDPEVVHAITPMDAMSSMSRGSSDESQDEMHQDLMQGLQKRSFVREALPNSCRSPKQSIIGTDRLLQAVSPQQRKHRPSPLMEDTERRHRAGPFDGGSPGIAGPVGTYYACAT